MKLRVLLLNTEMIRSVRRIRTLHSTQLVLELKKYIIHIIYLLLKIVNCVSEEVRKNIFIVIEVVDIVYSFPSYGDVIKDQPVHQAVLHPPDDLLLAQDAGGGHGDVLEGQTVDISGSSLLRFIRPRLKSCSKSVELKCN